MTKKPKDDEWAWSGRESPFRKKLADIRSDQHKASQAQGYPAQPRQPVPAFDPMAAVRQIPEPDQPLPEKNVLVDELTGFLTKQEFLPRLSYELKRGLRYKRPVAICLVTLDGLEQVKQLYGPDAAQMLLKLAADAVRAYVRGADIPALYSGDSLAIIFPETNAAGVKIPADRIRQKIREQVTKLGGENVYVTASIGLASCPAHAREPQELIEKALAAVQSGASTGGDTIVSA